MEVLVFGATNSKDSINKQLAIYASSLLKDAKVKVLDLNDFEMPLYGIDQEKESGVPELAYTFKKHLRACDAVIISFAEFNGSYTVAFKNVMDWISRTEGSSIWEDKNAVLLATSPGSRGGATVLAHAADTLQWRGLNVLGTFSLPSFGANFSSESGITDPELKSSLMAELKKLETA